MCTSVQGHLRLQEASLLTVAGLGWLGSAHGSCCWGMTSNSVLGSSGKS